jgi:hypothetical protein
MKTLKKEFEKLFKQHLAGKLDSNGTKREHPSMKEEAITRIFEQKDKSRKIC